MIGHSFVEVFRVIERMREIGVTICLVKLASGCNKVSVSEKSESRKVNKNHAFFFAMKTVVQISLFQY